MFFATATLAFLGLALEVLARGVLAEPAAGAEPTPPVLADTALVPVLRLLVPYWGVGLVLAAAAALIALAGGDEQVIVRFYAVAVFASFLGALIGCARLSLRDGMRTAFAVNALGTVLVAFVLVINMTRVDAVVSLLATAAIALYLWRAWIARGRPHGIATAMR